MRRIRDGTREPPATRGRRPTHREGRALTAGSRSRRQLILRAMSAPAIEVKGLRKTYGTLEAVKGIDLSVSSGEVFAMLGPNGAGKTTTVEILEGHRKRTAGDVSVLGFDPAGGERRFRERIGI